MSTEIQKQITTKSLFQQKSIQERFEQLLGKKAQGFISSVLQVVQNSKYLEKADPRTVLNAAATAAALDLPINPNLGFSFIVPYKGQAQFQMGWRGYVQLALRTGQYERINVVPVHENQFKKWDSLTESLDADFGIEPSGKAVGYVAYFRLINGFEKTVFWSRDKVEKHAKRYSETYKRGGGVWADGEDGYTAMALKTVLKNTLSKWGIMSIEMQTAHLSDQSVQTNEGDYRYPDNTVDIEAMEAEEETARALEFIEKAETVEDLEMIEDGFPDMPDEVKEALEAKKATIKTEK